MQKFKKLYYICLFYSLILFIFKFLKQEKMKEMEQEPVLEGGTPLSTKEIVKRIVGNNFRGFGFRPTQCSTSTTSRATLIETKLHEIIDSQAKELKSTRKELHNTRVELSNTCAELNNIRSELEKQQEQMNHEKKRLDRIEKSLFPIDVNVRLLKLFVILYFLLLNNFHFSNFKFLLIASIM